MKEKRSNAWVFLSVVLLLPLFGCGNDADTGLTDEQKLLVDELNQALHPLPGSPLTLADSDLRWLDGLSQARIVALGEATHGTREFFQLKHRFFRYLAEHHGHKLFGFEADFAESIYLDRYVTGGEGDVEDLMKRYMHFWTWKTEEVRDLLVWMREYNRDRLARDQLRYFGFDCQFLDLQKPLLQIYLQSRAPTFWGELEPLLTEIEALSNDDYQSMSPERYSQLKDRLDDSYRRWDDWQRELVRESNDFEYQIHRQLFNTFRQAFHVSRAYADETESTNWRDLYMAENARWLADLLGPETKITLWAHNGHVAKETQYLSGSMGHYLDVGMGNSYRVIGFSFCTGSFTAVGYNTQTGQYTGLAQHQIDSQPLADSLNFLFHQANSKQFAFSFLGVPPATAWERWLQTNHPYLSIGAVYSGTPDNYYYAADLKQLYDWMVHVDSTTASRPVPAS